MEVMVVVRVVCTRCVEVLPVDDSVETLRMAEAVRWSPRVRRL